jgi:hypothetical protein
MEVIVPHERRSDAVLGEGRDLLLRAQLNNRLRLCWQNEQSKDVGLSQGHHYEKQGRAGGHCCRDLIFELMIICRP